MRCIRAHSQKHTMKPDNHEPWFELFFPTNGLQFLIIHEGHDGTDKASEEESKSNNDVWH